MPSGGKQQLLNTYIHFSKERLLCVLFRVRDVVCILNKGRKHISLIAYRGHLILFHCKRFVFIIMGTELQFISNIYWCFVFFILYNQHFNVTDTFALIIRCALPVWTVFSELFHPLLLPFSVILYSLLSLLSTLLWSRQLLGVCWSYVCQPIHKKYWPHKNWSKSSSPINLVDWQKIDQLLYWLSIMSVFKQHK